MNNQNIRKVKAFGIRISAFALVFMLFMGNLPRGVFADDAIEMPEDIGVGEIMPIENSQDEDGTCESIEDGTVDEDLPVPNMPIVVEEPSEEPVIAPESGGCEPDPSETTDTSDTTSEAEENGYALLYSNMGIVHSLHSKAVHLRAILERGASGRYRTLRLVCLSVGRSMRAPAF